MALLARHRLELRQPLRGRVRAVPFVLLERDLLFPDLAGRLVLDQLLRGERHDLGVEASIPLPRGGPLLAHQRILVLGLAGDVVALRHHLRGLEHGHVQFRLVLVHPRLADPVLVLVLGLHQADRLDAAGDHDGDPVHDDPLGRDGDRLHPRRAEPVDGRAPRRDGEAGAQRGLAADVLAGRAFGHGAPHDHVLDLGGIQPRALDGVADHMAGEGRAVGVVEGAAVGLADGDAGSRDDDGVCHGGLLWDLNGFWSRCFRDDTACQAGCRGPTR